MHGQGVERHELPCGARDHLRTAVGDREQHGQVLVGVGGDHPRFDLFEQPFGLQRSGVERLDVFGLAPLVSHEQEVHPLAADQIEDGQRVPARPGEGGEVMAPDLAGPVLDPVGPRLGTDRLTGWPGRDREVLGL
jgi:hypothetical protein